MGDQQQSGFFLMIDLLLCLDSTLYLTGISFPMLDTSSFVGILGFARRLNALLETYFLYIIFAIF